VGESGCGKTTLAKSLLGLLPRNGSIVGGSILWDGVNVTKYSEKEWNKLRWSEIAMVPQNALTAWIRFTGYAIRLSKQSVAISLFLFKKLDRMHESYL